MLLISFLKIASPQSADKSNSRVFAEDFAAQLLQLPPDTKPEHSYPRSIKISAPVIDQSIHTQDQTSPVMPNKPARAACTTP
jgi:hypothetical protein